MKNMILVLFTKSRLLLIAILLVQFCLFAQKREYNENFNVLEETQLALIVESISEENHLLLEIKSLDELYPECGILLFKKSYSRFIKDLKLLANIYADLSNKYHEAGVLAITEEFYFRIDYDTYFYYGDSYQYSWADEFKLYFHVNNSEHSLIITCGEISSASEKNVTHEGMIIVFKSHQRILNFIDFLTEQSINFSN